MGDSDMVKFKLNYNPKNVQKCFDAMKGIKDLFISHTLVERISTSGDTTGTPFYHFRWKHINLADFVAYPETNEHVKQIIRAANEYGVSVTPRGSGSCYYGSGIPTNGGLVMDMKRMKSFAINKESGTVTTQPGIVFSSLMTELAKQGLEIGCYPTSAYTTTIGGWIGTGGSMGIGTLQAGGFIDQIVSLKVITPTGEEKTLEGKENMAHLFGTGGIFDVIVEITIKLLPIPQKQAALSYGFNSRADLLKTVEELVKTQDPFTLRFSDKGHEFRSTGFSKYDYYLFIYLKGRNKPFDEEYQQAWEVITKNHGEYLGELYSRRIWDEYLKHEMKIKLDNPVLMLQQIVVTFNVVPELIDHFEKWAEEYKINHAYYGIINKDMKVRLVFYTPTDNTFWLHFLASKAVLHRLVKLGYKLGGRVYTYGLQNTVYLQRFEKEKAESLSKLKHESDPKYILNPLKVVKTKISFNRVNIMFELALMFRKISLNSGKGAIILTPDMPGKH
jgi:glycolate oxidase